MATKQLTIASIRYNVYENHISSPESRLAFVNRCVRDIVYSHYSGHADKYLVITGPEYMFARKNYTLSDFNRNEFKQWDNSKAPTMSPGAKRGQVVFSDTDNDMEESVTKRRKTAYTNKEKDSIITELCKTCSGFPNLLLLPGTIMWREYLYLKKLFKRRSPVYNTAPILSDGEEVHLYDKKNGSDEIKVDYRLRNTDFGDQAERYRFSPGTASGAFQWKGIQCGIEICADHSSNALKNELGQTKVDLHFMLSAGMQPMKAANCAKQGGMMISNDGSKQDNSQQVNVIQQGGLMTASDTSSTDSDWLVWTETLDI